MQRLIKFCHDHGIYCSMHYNLKHAVEWKGCNERIISLYSNKLNEILSGESWEAYNFFNYAFHWSETREGHDFWNEISALWNRRCQRDKIKNLLIIK